MVKASNIEKDIKGLAKKHKIAVFNYDEIHNQNVDNQFHYDYKKVIKEVAQNTGQEESQAEQTLTERGILVPLPNGEYEVDVGRSTQGGGGINYGGDVFFSYSKNDYHTQYHELAHTLQHQYNLFDEEKVNKLYEHSESGIKNKQKIDKKIIDRSTYLRYLGELHSEVFASAALMLRAENRRDFWWQAAQAYNMGINRNANAIIDIKKQEYDSKHNSKFYSTKSVMRPLIKEIYKIRKSGELGSYFDKDGVIDSEKLAKLCEGVVLKNAYSPRTLNSFFKYKVFDGHTSQEKGWKRDAAKTVLETPLLIVLDLHNGIKSAYNSSRMHRKLRDKQHRQTFDFISTPKKHDDPEMKALLEYERLKVAIEFYGKFYKNNDLRDLLTQHIDKMSDGNMSDAIIKTLADKAADKKSEKRQMEWAFKSVREIYRQNKDDPLFKKVAESGVSIFSLKNLIKTRQENPQESVISNVTKAPERFGSETYPVKRQINKINAFAEKHNMSTSFTHNVLKELTDNPQIFADPEIRIKVIQGKKIKNDFLGFKKRKFTKELNELFDQISFSYYSNKNNPAYQGLLKDLSSLPPEKMLEKINEIEEQKKQLAAKNKETEANAQGMSNQPATKNFAEEFSKNGASQKQEQGPQAQKPIDLTKEDEQNIERLNNENKKFASIAAMRQKLSEGHNPQPAAEGADNPTAQTQHFVKTTISTEQIQKKLQDKVKG